MDVMALQQVSALVSVEILVQTVQILERRRHPQQVAQQGAQQSLYQVQTLHLHPLHQLAVVAVILNGHLVVTTLLDLGCPIP